jgi:hypothetical protein
MRYATTHTSNDPVAQDSRVERPLEAYWHARIQGVLERLEREARRMFQLEADIRQFAEEYYATVGAAAERLSAMEQQLASASAVAEVLPVRHQALMAQRDTLDARQSEIKSRYRSLAKSLHPDRAPEQQPDTRSITQMHQLNTAYHRGDLAAMLRLEGDMLVHSLLRDIAHGTLALEHALHDIERAADTYAEGYRALLHSPLNELMLRALSARMAGWDWMQAVVRNIERRIEEKARAGIEAGIAEIGAWRAHVVATQANAA